MISKCVHRLKIEEIIQSGGTPEENDCYRCYGFKRTCSNYTDLQHLLQFYELFKQDKGATQCRS